MIDQSVVERILETARVVEVVQDFVSLKKRGANYVGLCPFHHEKTPSFNVSPSKNIFKCFGCGKGGNVVQFLMEHEHFSYVEALRYLARKYHIEIQETEKSPEDIQRENERESLSVVTEYACRYFREQLLHTDEGKQIGLSYFRERGFRDDIIEKFQLGYSPAQSDAFLQEALRQGFKKEYLVKSGLVIENERGMYDRFHGRVIFPVHSLSGKVIAFGGRILRSDKNTAKYINSPESELYHKSKILYGIYHARNEIIRQDKCYLVEGYTDVISLHQAGIENVVASSGTSLTVDQIRLIKRFTSNITILYDGDPAGIKASLRGIDMILEEGMNVRVLLFPDNEDPDSFSRTRSASEVVDFIRHNETDFVLFKTRLLMDEAQHDPVKKATLIHDVIGSIAQIPDPIKRSVYIKECSVLLETDEKVIYSRVNEIRRKKAEQYYRSQNISVSYPEDNVPAALVQPLPRSETEAVEREIIRLLLMYGNHPMMLKDAGGSSQITVAEYIFMDFEYDELTLYHPVYKQIYEEYLYCFKNHLPVSEKYFIHHQEKEISTTVTDILSYYERYKESRIWKKFNASCASEADRLNELVPLTLMSYKEKVLKKQMNKLQQEIAENTHDESKMEESIRAFMRICFLRKNLSKTLGEKIIIY